MQVFTHYFAFHALKLIYLPCLTELRKRNADQLALEGESDDEEEDFAPVHPAKRQKAHPLRTVLDDDEEDIADDIQVPDNVEDKDEDIPGDEGPDVEGLINVDARDGNLDFFSSNVEDGNLDLFSSNGASVCYITSTPLFDLPIQSAQNQRTQRTGVQTIFEVG
jgi:hypothetical protein